MMSAQLLIVQIIFLCCLTASLILFRRAKSKGAAEEFSALYWPIWIAVVASLVVMAVDKNMDRQTNFSILGSMVYLGGIWIGANYQYLLETGKLNW